jgi:hypothetical protein
MGQDNLVQTYQFRCDSNYWNLDALEFWSKPNAEGSIVLQPIIDDLGSIKRIAIVNNQHLGQSSLILALRPEARLLQNIFTSPSNQPLTYHLWKRDEELIDMAVHAGKLFVLMKRGGTQSIVQFRVHRRGMIPENEWAIDSHPITSLSRIKVTSIEDTTVAYIGPIYDRHLLSIGLDEPPLIRILKVNVSDVKESLGRNWDFCIDARRRTLIIADSENHRIVEVDRITGIAHVICGTGRAGTASDGEVAVKAALNYPHAVAVYRPSEVIRQGLLSEQSMTFLTSDPEQAIPRTILIADTGNFRIIKLIELPFIASQTLSIPDDPFVYTLIGARKEARGGLTKLSKEHKSDLRRYMIPEPSDLAISESGELLVGCGSNQFLIFLRPTSAISDEVIAFRRRDIHDTDP